MQPYTFKYCIDIYFPWLLKLSHPNYKMKYEALINLTLPHILACTFLPLPPNRIRSQILVTSIFSVYMIMIMLKFFLGQAIETGYDPFHLSTNSFCGVMYLLSDHPRNLFECIKFTHLESFLLKAIKPKLSSTFFCK